MGRRQRLNPGPEGPPCVLALPLPRRGQSGQEGVHVLLHGCKSVHLHSAGAGACHVLEPVPHDGRERVLEESQPIVGLRQGPDRLVESGTLFVG